MAGAWCVAGSRGAQRSRAGAGLAWALTPALTLDPGREQVPGGRLLPRGPAMPKVCTQASEVGAAGFTAVESETGREEAVRGTGVTATPLAWPQMEDGIHV